MNVFDIIVTFTLLMSTVTGLYFGVIMDLATSLLLLISTLAVIYGTPHFLPAFQGILGDGLFATLVCMVFLYSAIFFPGNFVRHYFFRMVRIVVLGIFDKPFGAISGFIRGVLVVTVGFMVYLWIWNPPMDAPFLQESKTLKKVEEYTIEVVSLLPEGLVNKTRKFVSMTSRQKDDLKQKTEQIQKAGQQVDQAISDPKKAIEQAEESLKTGTQQGIENLQDSSEKAAQSLDKNTEKFSNTVLENEGDLIVQDKPSN